MNTSLSKKDRKRFGKQVQAKLLASGLKDDITLNTVKVEKYVDAQGQPMVFDPTKVNPETGMPILRALLKGESLAKKGEPGLQQLEVPKLTASNPVRNITKKILNGGYEAVRQFLAVPITPQIDSPTVEAVDVANVDTQQA
jgi:hypothetical protein